MQNRIKVAFRLFLLVSLFVHARASAEGQQSGIKVEPESLKVTITSGATADFTLSLTNTTKDSVALELEAGKLIFTASDQIAEMRFPENGQEKERMRVTLAAAAPRNQREVKLKATKVKFVGVYEGVLIMRDLARGTEEKISVQIKKTAPPHFDLELAGVEQRDGRIELESGANDTVFAFLLKNPPTGSYRALKLEFTPDTSFRASLMPARFALEPGNEQMVTLRLSEMAGGKVSMGMLTIVDEMAPESRKAFVLTLRSSFRSPTQIAVFALLVFAGSVFSLILGTAIPRTIVKLKNRRGLREMAIGIRDHAESGSPINVKLAVLRNKLGYLNEGIKWYGVTVTERVEEINRLKADLEADLNLVVAVKHLRNRVEQTALIPRSLEAKVENLLTLVEQNLLEGDRENAKARIDEARKIFDEKEALQQLQAELAEAINQLPASSGLDWIDGLINQLKAAQAASLPVERLSEVQRQYAIVDLYLNKFKNDVLKRFPDFNAHEGDLLELLRKGLASDAALQEAEDLVNGMNLKLFEPDVVDDVQHGRGSIEASTITPLPEQIITFRFVLHDRHKDECFWAQRLKYEWNFGDATNVDVGKERVHYFRKKPPSWWSRLKNLRRGRNAAPSAKADYEVKLSVKDRAGKEIAAAPYKKDIFVRSYHDKKYRADISSVESITFITAFLIALGFAINLHFDEIRHFLSFKDWVTPFLWGFGLDQGKNTFMESFKSIAPGAGKVE
jgi:hypothetical protein